MILYLAASPQLVAVLARIREIAGQLLAVLAVPVAAAAVGLLALQQEAQEILRQFLRPKATTAAAMAVRQQVRTQPAAVEAQAQLEQTRQIQILAALGEAEPHQPLPGHLLLMPVVGVGLRMT